MTKGVRTLSFRETLLAQEQKQRETLAALVDDSFIAYREAGGTNEQYTRTQFFEALLFKAILDTPEGTYQRQGAYLVAIRFMQALIQHYQDQKLDPERQKDNARLQR